MARRFDRITPTCLWFLAAVDVANRERTPEAWAFVHWLGDRIRWEAELPQFTRNTKRNREMPFRPLLESSMA